MIQLDDVLAAMPLVAILRGLEPEEAAPLGDVLFDAGFRCLEVPLNSPHPMHSIATLADRLGRHALIGAGTVLSEKAVEEVAAAGGRLIVMPHADIAVIRAAKRHGMICIPGAATPTEAFAAIAAGADAIKMFPAEALPPEVAKAWLAVLPRRIPLLAVGGITPGRMAAYRAAGVAGFGLGSALFRPGIGAEALRENARAFTAALAEASGG